MFQLPLEVLEIRPVPQILSKVVLDQSGSRLTDLNLEESIEHLAQLLLLPEQILQRDQVIIHEIWLRGGYTNKGLSRLHFTKN